MLSIMELRQYCFGVKSKSSNNKVKTLYKKLLCTSLFNHPYYNYNEREVIHIVYKKVMRIYKHK